MGLPYTSHCLFAGRQYICNGMCLTGTVGTWAEAPTVPVTLLKRNDPVGQISYETEDSRPPGSGPDMKHLKTSLASVAFALSVPFASGGDLCPAGYYITNGLLPGVPAPPGYFV